MFLLYRFSISDYLKFCLKYDKCMILYIYISGTWLGIRRVFPGVNIKGCVFHWAQAVWRHVQEFGLVRASAQLQPIHMAQPSEQ